MFLVFPVGSDGKEYTCIAGDLGLIPGLGRSPGGRHGNPLQYSSLENPMDRGAWWAAVHGVAKSQTRLSDQVHNENLLYSTENSMLCGDKEGLYVYAQLMYFAL